LGNLKLLPKKLYGLFTWNRWSRSWSIRRPRWRGRRWGTAGPRTACSSRGSRRTRSRSSSTASDQLSENWRGKRWSRRGTGLRRRELWPVWTKSLKAKL